MNFILRPFVSEEIHHLKMKKIILLSLFVLVILTFWQFIIVPSFILNKENYPSEKYLLLLKEQEMYDKYQLELSNWRKIQYFPMIVRHNEMFLTGEVLPDTFSYHEMISVATGVDRYGNIIFGKRENPKFVTISDTTKLLKLIADAAKTNEKLTIDQVEKIKLQLLQIEASGQKDLEYVTCINGIICVFDGPLNELNNKVHLMKILNGDKQEVKGADDFPPNVSKTPPTISVLSEKEKKNVPEHIMLYYNFIFEGGLIANVVLTFAGITYFSLKNKKDNKDIFKSDMLTSSKDPYRSGFCSNCGKEI